MLSLLSWIPLIGPILQGVGSIVSNFTNLAAVKLQTGAQTDIATTQAAVQIIHDTNDDIGLRIMRDAALVFPVGWSALIGWDTIVSANWPWLMFHVNPYPPAVAYIPYVAFAFLFGNIGFKIWKNK
jgi:hypothetical protein